MSKASVNHIGHHARIPLHIAHALCSERAKSVWRELAFYSSPSKPTVWVSQKKIAETLGVSTKTIGRALKELIEHGLLQFVGWFDGKFKTYLMAWKKFLTSERQNCPTTQDTNVQAPQTNVSEDPRQNCPNINREEHQSRNQFILSKRDSGSDSSHNSTQETNLESIIHQYEAQLRKKYPVIDGKQGRPTLKACMEQALNHTARHKYDSIKVYLEMWLQNASNRWSSRYIKTAEIYVETDSERERRLNWDRIRLEKQRMEAAQYFKKV